MRKITAYIVVIVTALALSLLAVGGCKPQPPSHPSTPASGSGAPPAAATPPEGFALMDASSFNVANYKGQVLLLDFWATWCGPCKMEIPHLIELQKQYRDQGLQVIGITLDENPDRDVPKYAAEVGMNYPNVRGNDKLKSEYGVVGIPTLVLYDRDGNKVMSRAGYIEKKELEAKIVPLLNPLPK